jgi:hypothetical protein
MIKNIKKIEKDEQRTKEGVERPKHEFIYLFIYLFWKI